VQNCASGLEICPLSKAARPMTWTGGDERSARGRAQVTFQDGADLAISWYASFCGAARPADEALETVNVGKWHSLDFKKVARGRPADGTPWPFCF
jgi:hypothetical protein